MANTTSTKIFAILELLETILLQVVDKEETLRDYACLHSQALRGRPQRETLLPAAAHGLGPVPQLFALHRGNRAFGDAIDGTKRLRTTMLLEDSAAIITTRSTLADTALVWLLYKSRTAISPKTASCLQRSDPRHITITTELLGIDLHVPCDDESPLYPDLRSRRGCLRRCRSHALKPARTIVARFSRPDGSSRAVKLTNEYEIRAAVSYRGEVVEYGEPWTDGDEPVTLGRVFDKHCDILKRSQARRERKAHRSLKPKAIAEWRKGIEISWS